MGYDLCQLETNKPRWRKRGRPKLERTPKDLGTSELQDKRSLLYGVEHHLRFKGSPSLDLLFHHHVLTSTHYEAGQLYYTLSQEALRGMEVRPTSRSCIVALGEIQVDHSQRSADVPVYALRKLKQWRRLDQHLNSIDSKLSPLLRRVLVEQRLPKTYIDASNPNPEVQLLKQGLEAVAGYFKILSH